MEPDYKKKDRTAQPKPKTCKELYPNGSDERLACCAAGNKTTWSGDETTGICKCNDNTKEWKNGTCVAKSAPKTCTPACSANQTCENGKCVDKQCNPACGENQTCKDGTCVADTKGGEGADAGTIKPADSTKEVPETLSIQVATKADNDDIYKAVKLKLGSGVNCSKDSIKWIVDKQYYIKCGEKAYNVNFDRVFCGIYEESLNGYCVQPDIIRVFDDVEVNRKQGDILIKDWFNTQGISVYNCETNHRLSGNQDWLVCRTNSKVYKFEFDDLKETGPLDQATSIMSYFCKKFGGIWGSVLHECTSITDDQCEQIGKKWKESGLTYYNTSHNGGVCKMIQN